MFSDNFDCTRDGVEKYRQRKKWNIMHQHVPVNTYKLVATSTDHLRGTYDDPSIGCVVMKHYLYWLKCAVNRNVDNKTQIGLEGVLILREKNI